MSNECIKLRYDTNTNTAKVFSTNNIAYVLKCTNTPTPTVTPTPSVSDSCPSPDMKILLHNKGYIRAGDVNIGDKVLSYHENSMLYGEYTVSHKSIVQAERLLIKFDHIDFVCSASHKFYYKDSWIEAKDLKTGDILNNHTIFNIINYSYGDVIKLTIDDAHTYICEDLLSHNKQITSTPTVTPTVTPTPSLVCQCTYTYNNGSWSLTSDNCIACNAECPSNPLFPSNPVNGEQASFSCGSLPD